MNEETEFDRPPPPTPTPAPMPDPAASPAHLRRALELYESLLDARALAEAMDGSFASAPIFRLKIGRQIGLDALGLSEMAVGLRLRGLILADIESWKAAAGELLRVQFKIPIAVIAEMEREHARRGRDWTMTGDPVVCAVGCETGEEAGDEAGDETGRHRGDHGARR